MMNGLVVSDAQVETGLRLRIILVPLALISYGLQGFLGRFYWANESLNKQSTRGMLVVPKPLGIAHAGKIHQGVLYA
ncbi:hypothetical protein LZ32DRAFT_89728 [Colletotrichum eremochloae]|nr:hypothetical protein LZ32DRAFT_89728 [Colletotrichum eremochloae]